MMILIDSATKLDQFLTSASKEYIATVKTGIKTDTEDIDGKVLEEKKETMPAREEIEKALSSFLGKSYQRPPMMSAIKINGKKLYEYHREGKTVEVEPREIEVYAIELLDVDEETFTFKTKVSSGTYIRTLAQDVLNMLGIIGTLSELRRTKIDDFRIEDAYTLEEIEKGEYRELDAYEVLSRYYPVYQVTDRRAIIDGKPLSIDMDDEMILCADGREALAIYKKEDSTYRCKRGLL